MVDLLAALGDFFGGVGRYFFESRVSRAIYDLQNTHGKTNLDQYWGALDTDVKTDPRVTTAHDDAVKRVTSEKDLGMFGAIPAALVEGFAALESQLADAAGKGLTDGIAGGEALAAGLVDATAKPLMDAIFASAEAMGGELPPDLKQRIVDSILPLITVGLTWEVGTALAELIHPTKNMGLGGVSHFLHDTVGFSSMTGAYIDPIRHGLIVTPLQKSINQIVRPYVPELGIVAEMTRGHHLSEEKYRTALARHGIMSEYADVMVDEVWTQPGLRNLLIISQFARPDPVPDAEGREFLQGGGLGEYIGSDWYLAEKLAKSGFKNRDIAYLMKALKQRTINAIVANIYSIRKSQFAAGKIDRSEYETFLKSRGFSADEVREALDAIQDDLDANDRQQLAALYEKKFLNGRLSEGDLQTALKKLDKKDAYIDTRIKLLTEQKLGKLDSVSDNKVLSRLDYEKQYAAGKITRTQFINFLDVAGWSLQDAITIADIQDRDTLDGVRTEVIRAAEESAKNNRMSLTDLEAVYTANGKSKEWAHARRDYIEQTILGKIEVTTTTTTADTLKAEQAERIRAAEQEAKNLRMSRAGLIAVYLANGKTQAWADARADYIGEIITGKAGTSESV